MSTGKTKFIKIITHSSNPFRDICIYLASIKSDPKVVTRLVNECDINTGKTPLHFASEMGNLDLIKLLLANDARTDIKDKQQNLPIDLVPKHARDVRALLSSRGKWQQDAQEKLEFPVNRTVYLVESVFEKLKEHSTNLESAVIFIGNTGAGKSTLINYLLGTNYVNDKNQYGIRFLRPETAGNEQAKTSAESSSETLFPSIYYDNVSECFYVDMAGSLETRGVSEKICAGIGTDFVTSKFNSLKSIVIVCEGADITSSRKLMLREAFQNVGKIIASSPFELAKNIILVVTRLDREIEKNREEVVFNNLMSWRDGSEFYNVTNTSDPDLYAIKRVLDKLGKDQIFVADEYNQATREKLIGKLMLIENRPMRYLNFSHYQKEAEKFKLFIKEMQVSRQKLLDECEKYTSALCCQWNSKLDVVNLSNLVATKTDISNLSEMVKTEFKSVFDKVISFEAELAINHSEITMLSAEVESIFKERITESAVVTGMDETIDAELMRRVDELNVNADFFNVLDVVAALLGSDDKGDNQKNTNKIKPIAVASVPNRNSFHAQLPNTNISSPNINPQTDLQFVANK